MTRSIQQLITGLEALGPGGFGDAEVRDLLLAGPGLAELKPYLSFEPGRYTRNLIHRDRNFELLALCWAPGAASDIHNHGGQRCWFRVESGTFDVQNYDLLGGGREPGYALVAPRGERTRMDSGTIDYKNETDEIHRVAVADGSGPAISLHVYAGPVASFLVYDPLTESCELRSSFYDPLPVAAR